MNPRSSRYRSGFRSTSAYSRGLLLLSLLIEVGRSQPLQTQILHGFGRAPATPEAPLVQAADGCLYGTTKDGGAYGHGTVFKITPNGNETTLVAFNGINGADPWAGLVQAVDGDLYGTTYAGGSWGKGTVFKVSTNCTLTILLSFEGTNGAHPYSGLTLASDGNLYGTAYTGGEFNNGTVYRLTPSGKLTTLHSFRYNLVESGYPRARLVQGTDGNLYGINLSGGVTNCLGAIFRISLTGDLTTLVSFDGSNGAGSRSGLIQAADGYFYGSSYLGVFRLSASGDLTPLASFPINAGISPLVQATNGGFYGTTQNGGEFDLGCVFEMTVDGTLTSVLSFDGTNGANPPLAGLIQGTDGALYGTTESGGLNNRGTVFKVSMTGQLTTLHAFHSPDGALVDASLTEASNGSLYGATTSGGKYGCGTAFRMTRAGDFTKILDVDGVTAGAPSAWVENPGGYFYCVSPTGGQNGDGVFFRLYPDGNVTSLLSFDWHLTGSRPSSLTLGSDGFFYGTSRYSTNWGAGVFRVDTNGVLSCLGSVLGWGWVGPLIEGTDRRFYGIVAGPGGGTFVRVQPGGEVAVLYSFDRVQGTDDADPSSLLEGIDGSFYGTTTSYGGTFFRISPNGTIATLFRFNTSIGASPRLLTRTADGSFYGVTSEYGPYYRGTLFKITTNGVATVLRSFGDTGLLTAPQSLILGRDDIFYGTFYGYGAFGDGAAYDGSVFRLMTATTISSIAQHPTGTFLTAMGPANQPLRLWYGPQVNLSVSEWTLCTTGSFNQQGVFSFIDLSGSTNVSRFYRLSIP